MIRVRGIQVLVFFGSMLGSGFGFGQATHLGIPAADCLVLEGIASGSTERRWTLLQGGIPQPSVIASAFRVPADRKLVLTDLKFTLRGQPGKSANVVVSVKQGIQPFQVFRLTMRLLAGLDQNVHSEHFTTPIVLAEGSELSTFLGVSNNGVVLESCLLYGYYLSVAR